MVLGKRSAGMQDLSSYWEAWSGATQPALTPELVIAGRQSAADEIQQWLRGQPSVMGVQGETPEEAVAFFVAALQQMPEEKRDRIFARSAVVEAATVWPQLTASPTPLILIPTFADRAIVPQAVSAGHHILLPLGRSELALGQTIQIPRLQRAEATTALTGVGVAEGRAEDLAMLARRSLAALRRKLAINPAVLIPPWAEPQAARTLLAAALAGRWSDGNLADRDVIARLAGRGYTEVSDTLLRWANEADPPVRRVGDNWMVVSHEDAWLLLARYLSRDDLERFSAAVLDVMGAVDPQYELPPGERWAAAISGKTLSHSSDLRKGFAETLALMGAYSDLYPLGDTSTGQEWAALIVHQLFEKAQDWRLWASLSSHLPSLAEAAPEEFLAAVERGLVGQSPLLVNLFTDAEYHPMENSSHTGLLSALELLAWSTEYIGQATLLLAKLARLDPGGKLANRPIRSLQHIFLFQYPHTTAPQEQRLRVLDTIRRREPQVSWLILVDLLPIRNGIIHPTFEPRWRAWTPEDRPAVTDGELFRAASKIIQRLLVDVGTDGRRWRDLIKGLHALPQAALEATVERLATLDPETLASADRLSVWSSLRHVIALQLKFPDKAWAMAREQVERLQQIYTRFEPDDPVLQRGWLFANRPELPLAGDADLGKRENTVERLRMQAVQELLELGALLMVLDLTRQVERPSYVGIALGQSNVLTGREDEDRLLSDILGSPDTALRQMAFGFLQGRVRTRGQVWLETLRRREVVHTWTPQQRADLYQYLPFSPSTWEALEATDVETQRLYWLQVNIFGRGELPVENCEQAVLRFAQYGRLDAAVQLLTSDADRGRLGLRSQLIADVLERVVQEDTTQAIDWSALADDILELLDILEEAGAIDAGRLARLEWVFLPLLDRLEREPRVLHRALAEAPDFFVEVLSWIFKAEDEEPRQLSEEQQNRAHLG